MEKRRKNIKKKNNKNNKNKKNNKKVLIISMVLLALVITLFGITYSMLNYRKTSTNQQLILGEIYMHYNEGVAGINILDMMPRSNYDESQYFEFIIDGKNTNKKGNIIYNIQITKGDDEVDKTRISDRYLRFTLTEVSGENENILVDNQKYEEINNTTIYTNLIPKETNEEIEYKYRLYVWIDDEVIIGNTNEVDYTLDEWNKLYASIKVNVNGFYSTGEILTNKIKSKLGTEGLVAVNTLGELYDGTGEIREYRYSGNGNYCTYTDGVNDYNINVEIDVCPTSACKLQTYPTGPTIVSGDNDLFKWYGSCSGLGGTSINLKVENGTPIDSGLRNYIEFNNELWRIIGVFGNNVKIMKDLPLLENTYPNDTYVSGDTTYILKSPYAVNASAKYQYFTYNLFGENKFNSNWNNSAAMHYLNDETGNSYYVTNLSSSAKKLISDTTYYLGNVTSKENSDKLRTLYGTASELYKEERGSILCDSNVTANSHDANCNIWNGNYATWKGKISFLYPSDFAYASETDNWSKDVNLYHTNGGSYNNWMFNTGVGAVWFISPTSQDSIGATRISYGGNFGDSGVYFLSAFRPVLSLKSDVIVLSGDGSYNLPYKLLEI